MIYVSCSNRRVKPSSKICSWRRRDRQLHAVLAMKKTAASSQHMITQLRKIGHSRVLYTHATAATRVRRITQRRVRRPWGLYSDTSHLIWVAQQHSLGLSAASYHPSSSPLISSSPLCIRIRKARGLIFLSFVCTANVELIHLPLLGTRVQYMVGLSVLSSTAESMVFSQNHPHHIIG